MADHSFARAWTTVADLAPERTAIVGGRRPVTFGELHARATALAGWLAERGVGPGDTVAIDLLNAPEYLESFYAAQLLGAVPANVNYRYTGTELAYLLDNADAVALVHHDDFDGPVADALARLADDRRPAVVLRVDHARAVDTSTPPDHERVAYEDAIARSGRLPARPPSGDDLVFLYTGGTTGAPKAVMWRSDDLYRSLWQMARPGTEPPEPAAAIRAGKAAATSLPACPLMHGTGLFIALSTLAGGGTVVLLDTLRLDPAAVWDAVEREQVAVLTIVGDAFARPLVAALEAAPERWDLASLRAVTSSGVTWSPGAKRALLDVLPGVLLIDSLGASEGLMTRTETRATDDVAPARFARSERMVVITDDGRRAAPGDGRVGLLGVGGPIPLGYYKDPDKTAATFRTVDGDRYSIPGDYARFEVDGTITLLGRGSACVNTGGEKVYPEEVELACTEHPSVDDCVVIGLPDERWGEMVVAVVAPSAGVTIDAAALREHCRTRLAGYKVPKAFVALESLGRAPSGKADYRHLRAAATRALARDPGEQRAEHPEDDPDPRGARR